MYYHIDTIFYSIKINSIRLIQILILKNSTKNSIKIKSNK